MKIGPAFSRALKVVWRETQTRPGEPSEKSALAILVRDRFSTYCRFWSLYDAAGRAPRQWNWPAFLFSSLWFFFRRMHAWGTIWFILSPLLMTTFALLGLPWLSLLSFVVFRVLAGILANPLYLAHCRSIVRKVDAEHRGAHRRHLELQKASGVSYTALVIALAVTASQNTLINLIVGSISEPTLAQSAVHVAANPPDLPDPRIEEAERVAYQEQMRAIAMTAWPAGVPIEGNACIVELRLAPPGRVLEANVLEPCTLSEAQREMMLGEIRRTDFTIEGKMQFFNRHTLIGLRR
ncbi:DUF2628 domain-containing protein [Stenotrophomonas maltophilia]|uniref:DUF2628 domain-containing protein n=1 Tax=Stenotrophomonas maltophilia TaxID=40324 RepID=UPI0021ACB851|nr:DUF2628 domain-containing protein [Stenotrophomonas maltophilia]